MVARPGVLLAFAISIAATVPGCGVDDDSTVAPAVSRTEFVQAANAICKKQRVGLRGEIAEFLERRASDGESTPEDIADVAHFVILPMIETQLSLLYRLDMPKRDRDRITGILTIERLAIDEAALTGRISSITAVGRRFEKSAELFEEYGLTECANRPGSMTSAPRS